MKAFLINPYNETITEIDDDFRDITRFYSHLTEPGRHRVGTIQPVGISDKDDTLYVDDNGHLSEGRRCWSLSVAPGTAFAGRGVVVRTNHAGNTVAPSKDITLDFLHRNVKWLKAESTGDFTPTTEGFTDHPILGRTWTIQGGQPILRRVE